MTLPRAARSPLRYCHYAGLRCCRHDDASILLLYFRHIAIAIFAIFRRFHYFPLIRHFRPFFFSAFAAAAAIIAWLRRFRYYAFAFRHYAVDFDISFAAALFIITTAIDCFHLAPPLIFLSSMPPRLPPLSLADAPLIAP